MPEKYLLNSSPEGHRERLRNRYVNAGILSLSEHEKLELILTYAIPRKDVKPIAKTLLHIFDTVDKVFSADINRLKLVDGIGENSAVLISLIGDIISDIQERSIMSMELKSARSVLHNFICQKIGFSLREQMLMFCLDGKSRVKLIKTFGGVTNRLNFEINELAEEAKRVNAGYVILAHNHPNGALNASMQDIESTLSISSFLRKMHIELVDHYVVSGNNILSICGTGEDVFSAMDRF